MTADQVLWLLAVISFGLGAAEVTLGTFKMNWLCLGLMFVALTFLF